MSTPQAVHRLELMLRLRQSDVDRQETIVQDKHQLTQRYQKNISRMESLCQHLGASAAPNPVLAVNAGAYKHSLLNLISLQKQDLALSDADLAVARQHLMVAVSRREVMDQLSCRERQALQALENKAAQKQSDETAAQAYLRKTTRA